MNLSDASKISGTNLHSAFWTVQPLIAVMNDIESAVILPDEVKEVVSLFLCPRWILRQVSNAV